MPGLHHPVQKVDSSFDPTECCSMIDDFFAVYKLLKTARTRSMLIELSKELLTFEERIELSSKVMDYLSIDLNDLKS